jgi:hypothetical protein
MGVNCSNCNCTWNEELNSELKDILVSKYKSGKRENSLPMLRKSISGITKGKEYKFIL